VTSQRAAPGAKIEAALLAASLSPNRVRKVGAVLVARDGTEIAAYNAFPTGVRDLEDRHAGDGRFVWMEHAERHAIFEAARRGVATAGACLTTTFFSCIDCARAIVDAGHRGGATRSSEESPAMGLERRCCVVQLWSEVNRVASPASTRPSPISTIRSGAGLSSVRESS
jgi:tRNA(Arg) A34 adenosine deaminase TadA